MTVIFDGVASGLLLFLISVGLSVTLGLMNFVNLAHGAFAMLGGYTCVVLLNHGLLTCGETVHGAMMRMWSLERACELELIARQMGEPPVVISDYVIAKAGERMKKRRATDEYGLNEWRGLVRQVERKGFDFRV